MISIIDVYARPVNGTERESLLLLKVTCYHPQTGYINHITKNNKVSFTERVNTVLVDINYRINSAPVSTALV